MHFLHRPDSGIALPSAVAVSPPSATKRDDAADVSAYSDRGTAQAACNIRQTELRRGRRKSKDTGGKYDPVAP